MMTVTAAAPMTSKSVQYMRAFMGLFIRDVYVLRRELFPFVIRVCMNPLLFLFVFTYVIPHLSGPASSANPTASMGGGAAFSTVLLPGLMAVAIMFSGIAAVALPLAQEFGITREIDDRVMCPLPVAAVAIEKIIFSAIQSMIAAAIVFPLAYYVPATHAKTEVSSWLFLAAVLVLASLTAGALGLTIGTAVKPQQIGLIFGVVVIPITFLGCVYYPWAALTHIRWLQIGVLVNPIVYMSEGLRAALTPSLPHMNPLLILTMLVVFLVLLTWLGIRGFLRRVIG
ncbi:ABC transporter permease [Granulicella arctica]|uniref:Transport permease protein n=1 Tax=Granulicella arctica TaxID=940613 RepID=A0A7Y9TFP0_9BACT|nr:ABC transporter permease [Granulicella arctica]NYF77845.1 ABC-2 type transport system permease protein [Granulicella arctica]